MVRLLSVDDVAQRFRVSGRTVLRLLARRHLHGLRRDEFRRFTPYWAQDWAARHASPAPGGAPPGVTGDDGP
jgi:hypothetical protein